MYRVYDNKEKCFVEDNVYLAPNTRDLYILEKTMFGNYKVKPVLDNRYEWSRDIGIYDKNGALIFDGDIVEAQVSDDRTVKGVVSYSKELSGYVILCFDYDEYFTLGESISKYIEIIGNAFENDSD